MAEDEGTCPIESNIKSTAGNNNNNNNNNENDFLYDDDEFENAFEDSNDAEFDECDGDAIMDADEEWDSIHSSNDGQNIIAVRRKKANEEVIKVIGINEENPYGEGNEVAIIAAGGRPNVGINQMGAGGDPKQKCWICDVCNGINNLLESLKKYNYKCCICSYPYHPNVAIIYSNDWDGINENNPNEQIYTVWNCPFCTLKNEIHWMKCDGCECEKPPSNQVEISYSYIKPKKLNGAAQKQNNNNNHNNNQIYNFQPSHAQNQANNNNKNKREYKKKNVIRKPRIENIGVARNITEYPSRSVLNDKCEKRLSDIFGLPYTNKLLLPNNKNQWTINCDLAHARIEWSSYSNDAKKFVKEEIVGRGFAINNKNGYIACMSSNYIWVFQPNGCLDFKLVAKYIFSDEQRLLNEDVSNSRIRFLNNNIFVWSFSRSRVYSFKLYENSLILIDVIRDKYFKDSQTMDIAIANNLLILLFDRWCGVYKLYPKFEWYHAVAFATKSVNCFSLEIVDFDHEQADILPPPIVVNNCKKKPNQNKNNGFNIMDKIRGKRNSKSMKSMKQMKQMEEEKKENENNNADEFYAETNTNYLFINAENQLIGLHPTNPTFDFLHIASNAIHGKCKYCISKQYGVFYLSNDGKELFQSPNLHKNTCNKLICLNNKKFLNDKFYPIEDFHDLILREGIEKFCNLSFDETFGISGRLLLFCQTKKKEYVIHFIFNYQQLSHLSNELTKIDYYLMPGMNTDKKPFNLMVFIYQYLYGQDLIDTLLQSQMFNPALLKIKKQQEKQLENYKIKQEKQQIQQQDFLMIHNNHDQQQHDDDDDDMDIEYEKEGAM